MLPTKRKGASEHPASVSNPYGSSATSQRKRIRSEHAPSPSIRSRVVLDAVEIVRKKRPGRTVDSRCTGSVRKTAPSYYPSPPASRSDVPVSTPPDSPRRTVPSKDVEHPRCAVDDRQGLFHDLMIMLRRLKPILVQESVRDDPWKVLIAVRLLNVTTGKAAIPVFCKIISRWPTARDLVCAPHEELVQLLRPLGLYNKRARWLVDMSERFLEDRQILAPLLSGEHMTLSRLDYPGVGPYAHDSLRIFCASDADAWKHVMPQDKELVRYLRWRWAVDQGKAWYPGGIGVIGDVDVRYLVTLVDELAAHYDAAIGGEGYMYHFGNDICGVLESIGR